MMTKQETYDLIYSLHAAIENTTTDFIDAADAFDDAAAGANDAKHSLEGLLNAGLFGLDCLKKRLEIIAHLLVDNRIEVGLDLDEDYYDTKAESIIVERCAEIAELSCKIASIEVDLNSAVRKLSALDIYKK